MLSTSVCHVCRNPIADFENDDIVTRLEKDGEARWVRCGECSLWIAAPSRDEKMADCVPEGGGDSATWRPPKHEKDAEGSPPPPLAKPSTAERTARDMIGCFELRRFLARGGFGNVWLANHPGLDRQVALKIPLHPPDEKDTEEIERFLREAKAAASLRHPNIVAVFDSGYDKARVTPFIAADYIEGETLKDRLTRGLPDQVQAVEWVRDIARALNYAHSRGIVHRDIKPSNLMIMAETSCPMLMDFGLAARRKPGADALDATQSLIEGQFVGTMAYASREQALGDHRRVGPRSDIYSLGAVLYEMLTGQRPHGDGLAAILKRHEANEPPIPLDKLRPDLPRDLQAVCLKALDSDPDRRYASGEEFAQDLEHWLKGEPVLARRPSRIERTRRWVKRLSFPIVNVLALGITTTFAALFYAWKGWDQADKALERVKSESELGKARYYGAQMIFAQRAAELADYRWLKEILEEQAPDGSPKLDRRGFEWFYLKRFLSSKYNSCSVQERVARSVAFSPDGERIAIAADSGLLLWKSTDAEPVLFGENRKGHVLSVAFSPDGTRLASVGEDRNIEIWDIGTGKRHKLWENVESNAHYCVVFSPNGKRLATAGDDSRAAIWDVETGEPIQKLEGHDGAVFSVAFSPDGARLATASAGQVKVWDWELNRELKTLSGHRGAVRSVAFDHTGRQLASAGADQHVKIWNAVSFEEIQSFYAHDESVRCLAFSPNGRLLATASADFTVRVWDSALGTELYVFRHNNWVHSVAFSPDGQRLVLGSSDSTVGVWSIPMNLKPPAFNAGVGEIHSIALHSGGQRLAVAGEQGVRIWTFPAFEAPIAPVGVEGPVWSTTFSRDGTRLAIAKADNKVVIWDWSADPGAAVSAFDGHEKGVRWVSFSPDGTKLASAGEDCKVKIWDANSKGRELRSFEAGMGNSLFAAFSPDGEGLALMERTPVLKWQSEDASRERKSFLKRSEGGLLFVTFSPDGKLFAAGSDDFTIKIWNERFERLPTDLKGHGDDVTCVAFSPDGKRLASSSKDRTIKIWDMTSMQEVMTLKGHDAAVTAVVFSHDGQWLVSADAVGKVLLWSGPRD